MLVHFLIGELGLKVLLTHFKTVQLKTTWDLQLVHTLSHLK